MMMMMVVDGCGGVCRWRGKEGFITYYHYYGRIDGGVYLEF